MKKRRNNIRQVKLDKLVWQTRLNSFTKSREVICYSQSITSGPLKRSEEKSETPSISWLTSFYRLEFASFKNSGISHRYVYNSAKCSLAFYVKPLNNNHRLFLSYRLFYLNWPIISDAALVVIRRHTMLLLTLLRLIPPSWTWLASFIQPWNAGNNLTSSPVLPLALSVVNASCKVDMSSWLVYSFLGSSSLFPNTAKFPTAAPPLTQQPAVHRELGTVMAGNPGRSVLASLSALLGFLALNWSVSGFRRTNELPVKRYKVPSFLVQWFTA